MSGAVLLALLLQQPGGPYDPDPKHLWNRLHRAVHGWDVRNLGPWGDPDSIHWPAPPEDLSGESQRSLPPLLDELLAEEIRREPLQRAVLQRDLWMVFEWSVATEDRGGVWNRATNEEVPPDLAKHRELRKKLAAAIRRLALTLDQIRALPDTVAEAAKAHPALPADLLDPKGPWVVLGNQAGGPLASAHLEFFRGRADFTILLKLPGGRKATEEYAKKMSGIPPECPDGTQVALVRRSHLISESGHPVSSPITESVQLRILRHGREAESIKFQLRRAKLFAGQAGGLRPAEAGDKDAAFVLSLGHNKEEGRGNVLSSCLECHAGSSITSLEVVTPIRRKAKAFLAPSTFEDETFLTGRWTRDRYSFGLLKAAWDELGVSAPATTDVYVSGRDGYHTFRIPSALTTSKGTLLAFCEGRKNGRSDTGDIDLLLRRSTDGGATWGPIQTVWDDGPNTCGNPCPVVDRDTGTIWLLLTHNLGKDPQAKIVDGTSAGTRTVWVSRSDDDGLTWTKPVEITRDVKKPDWTWYATGPGVGIQLKSGRLLVPCDHSTAGTKFETSHTIYSDDHGKTWKLGGTTDDHLTEPQVVELADGTLLMNMRNHLNGKHERGVALSRDGGLTWAPATHDATLVEPPCQASILRHSPSRILFLNPASTMAREKMTVRLSLDDGKTWARSKEIHAGPAAYSCLALLADGSIGCLYEAGEKHAYEKIAFTRVALEWLEK